MLAVGCKAMRGRIRKKSETEQSCLRQPQCSARRSRHWQSTDAVTRRSQQQDAKKKLTALRRIGSCVMSLSELHLTEMRVPASESSGRTIAVVSGRTSGREMKLKAWICGPGDRSGQLRQSRSCPLSTRSTVFFFSPTLPARRTSRWIA